MDYTTIRVSREGAVCRVQLHRPDHDNTINDTMVRECHAALDACEHGCTVVVLEGLPHVFCYGADLTTYRTPDGEEPVTYDPTPLYDLWTRLAEGPYVTVAHARGRTNAGGVGFIAASDVVIAEPQATFSLSELLFGLYPAMVLPFLARRVGHQRARYMTLTTKAVTAEQALAWGLVDVCEERSGAALSRHLGRLSKLPKDGVAAYKRFTGDLNGSVREHRAAAVAPATSSASPASPSTASTPGSRPRVVPRPVDPARTGRHPWMREPA
jgi:polyketide biosynthesis enoyl-CoA hydratase PksH